MRKRKFSKWNQLIKKKRALIRYGDYYKSSKKELLSLLEHYSSQNKKVAIWGGGLKGTSFISVVDPKADKISCIVDMNQHLQGSKTATGHPIVDPDYLLEHNVDLVLVVNKVHFTEVYLLLTKSHYKGNVLSLDDIMEHDVKAEQANLNHESIFGYTVRDIQLKILEILNEVDRLCKENDITYFLEAGSALGAKRYGGFLPCDEDVDVGMLRKDYERFMDIAPKKLQKGFLLQRLGDGSDYPYPFAKVVMDQTCFVNVELRRLRMHHGIYVDVAPFDHVPSDKELRAIQFEKVRRYAKWIHKKLVPEPYDGKNPMNKLILNTSHYMLKPIPLPVFIKKLHSAMTKYSSQDTGYVGDLCTRYKKDVSYPVSDILPVGHMEFEGRKYPVPHNIHEYLSVLYGDYQTPSPKENAGFKYNLYLVSLNRNYDV